MHPGAEPLPPPAVVKMGCNLARQHRQGIPGGAVDVFRQVLVGEIDPGLDMGDGRDQPRPPALVNLPERPRRLIQGLAPLFRGFRRDQIGDGFGLGQVEPAIEEGAAGELPRLRRAQARDAAERRQHPLDHGRAPVQVEFHDILAGETTGAGKANNQGLVEGFAAGRIVKIAQRCLAGRGNIPARRQRRQGVSRPGTGQAHDRDARPGAAACQCKNGGVVHRPPSAARPGSPTWLFPDRPRGVASNRAPGRRPAHGPPAPDPRLPVWHSDTRRPRDK